MAMISDKLNKILSAIFGKDVRQALHDSLKAINEETENTTARQVHLEDTFDQMVINAGNSNAEIVDARVDKNTGVSYSKVGDRLDAHSSQLETKAKEIRKEVYTALTYNNGFEWEYGGMSESTGENGNFSNSSARTIMVYVKKGDLLKNVKNSKFSYKLFNYNADLTYVDFIDYINDEDYLITRTGYIRLQCRAIDSSNLNLIEVKDSIFIYPLEVRSLNQDVSYEIGVISSGTGENTTDLNTRVRSSMILVKQFSKVVLKDENYSVSVLKYNVEGKFIARLTDYTSEYEIADNCYVRLAIKNNSEKVLTDEISYISRIVFVDDVNYPVVEEETSPPPTDPPADNNASSNNEITFELGSVDGLVGGNSPELNERRARTKMIRVNNGDILSFSSSIYEYRYFIYDLDRNYKTEKTSYITSDYAITNDCYIRLLVKKISGDIIDNLTEVNERFSLETTFNGYVDFTNSANNLYKKSILNFGDSIAYNTGYASIIASKNDGQFYRYAIGGATITDCRSDNDRSWILDQINLAISENVTADYILFNGGTNDIVEDRTVLGDMIDSYEADFDTGTFAGAFEKTCQTLKLNFIDKKILYIRVHNMSSRNLSLQKQYGEMAIKICKKWAIPYIDLYSEGGLNTNIPEYQKKYTNATTEKPDGDGTHPNSLAYRVFYAPMIESKMKSI